METKSKKFFTEKDHTKLTNENSGICLMCNEIDFNGIEPDAEGYVCQSCGHASVMGLEQALLCGYVGIVNMVTEDGEEEED